MFTALLALSVAIGCRAQTAPQQAFSPVLSRRIELLVRSQFELPSDVTVSLGAKQPSSFTGFDNLPVTLSNSSGKSQVILFLISLDNTKLIHQEVVDLTKDPGNVDIAGRPMRGNPEAKVTVVNFDDLECPFCARMHQQLFPTTLDHYKGLVRIVYKDDPLVQIHPWAMHAAVDANCLAAQSSEVYWTYVDYLHSHGDEITGADRNPEKSAGALDRIARLEATLGKLDEAKVNACLTKQDQTQVQASLAEAQAMGLDGTPELFINGERINGAVPQEQLWAVIDRALRSAGVEPPPVVTPTAAVPHAGSGN